MRNIKMTMSRMQLNSKFVNNMFPEWDRFMTAVRGIIHGVEVQLGMGEHKTELGMLIQNSDYFKDKMLQMQAQENGVALDEEQLLFLACGQDNAIDEDAPTAQTMFMANLSSADPVYDEAGLSYDSDILSEYVKDNAVPGVQSNVSSIPNDAYMMIYNEMYEPHAQSVSKTSQNIVVDNLLTAELATYKEQVELYERRARFELTEREQNINEQLGIVITDRNFKEETLKKELHSIKLQRASTINHKKLMVIEAKSLKKDFKQKENKYLKDFLDMKSLKEKVDDTLFKQDQSLQTVHMLCRPKPYYNELKKKQLTPEQIFWSQDLIKMKTKALKEQTTASRPIKALTVHPPNIPATLIPRVLPTKSQVKIHIFLQLFLKFDKTCKKRITPTGLTEGERGFEQTKECYLKEVITFFKKLKEHFEGIQKALTTKIKEMKDVFEELEGEVAQNVVDRKHDEIKWKNLLIANDNLIAKCLSKEVFYVATNSELNVARFTEMHVVNTIVEARCLELEAELSNLCNKSHNDNYNEFVNRFSNLEVTALITENVNLKAQILNNMNSVSKDHVKPIILAPGKYAIDVEPIPSRLRNNRKVHLDYLRHLKESVEPIREIVKEAKVYRTHSYFSDAWTDKFRARTKSGSFSSLCTPTNKDMEILFQPMFDEYLEPPRVERPVSLAPAVQVPVNSAGTPSSTTIDQDAPSSSISPSSSALQSQSLHQGVADESTLMEDNPVAPIDYNPFVNVFAPELSFDALLIDNFRLRVLKYN
uniref:Integrase, catalytic region, zinc finger, CCHC-type, peptidase aspartic, catalytic n=1 Tax=Tanacetum cinerariifolium TaxID=118510 RepID=A0A699HZC7_TANCI|nr:hypothetical protein [Tanacetum cinerariifolium]